MNRCSCSCRRRTVKAVVVAERVEQRRAEVGAEQSRGSRGSRAEQGEQCRAEHSRVEQVDERLLAILSSGLLCLLHSHCLLTMTPFNHTAALCTLLLWTLARPPDPRPVARTNQNKTKQTKQNSSPLKILLDFFCGGELFCCFLFVRFAGRQAGRQAAAAADRTASANNMSDSSSSRPCQPPRW